MEAPHKKAKTIISEESTICKNFFSTSGCQYGEKCHYLHYIDSKLSYNPMKVQKAAGLGSCYTRKSSQGYKTQLCNRYGSDEGCIFGDKCHFAHGENDLRRDTAKSFFGEVSKARISFSASLASGIIGKGGANTKKIFHSTGVKLYIRDHECDPRLKNMEFEGPFESISKAKDMVEEIIERNEMMSRKQLESSKLCEKFAKGSCKFGDGCHFVHGVTELKNRGL